MNKQRRAQLTSVLIKLDEATEELQSIYDDEEEYYNNMPESLQGGEKGDASQQAMDSIEAAISSIEEANSSITEACN